MDSWPSVSRTSSSSQKKKVTAKQYSTPRNYPYVEQGTLNALTLVQDANRHFSWSSLVNNSSQDRQKLLARVPVSVFPATRPPNVNLPSASVTQRAEQGANFLRTFLPDVDVAEELIREHVAEDVALMRNFESFDPHIGNALELIYSHESISERSGYLAFPMGETRTELNLSPFHISDLEGTKIEPSVSPVRTFHTPIRQIVSSGSAMTDMNLVVRTYGSIEFLQVNIDETTLSIADMATFTSSQFGNRPVVDMKLQASSASLLLVNDHGSIYNRDYSSGLTNMAQVLTQHSESRTSPDSFWRIGIGEVPTECLLISNKTAWSVDTRTNSRVELFNITNLQDMLTSVENSINNNVLLCSTNELLWTDKRYPGRPMLGYKHYREFDRYLTAQTIHFTSPLTFLTSRKNGLISAYDVSYGQDRLIHVNMAPYALCLASQTDKLHTGQAFLPQLGQKKDNELGILRLGELGDVSYTELYTSDARQGPNIEILKSEAYEYLEASTGELHPDLGPLSDRQSIVVDLSAAYHYIFRDIEEETAQKEDNSPKDIHELLDVVSDFFQNTEQPLEQLLTTYDIVFRSGEEPSKGHRTDFLTGTQLSSKQGYHAIKRGLLPIETMAKRALWSLDITPTIKRNDPEISESIEELESTLGEYDLADDEGRSAVSKMRERRARERLIVDLALSYHIFSPHPFGGHGEGDSALETMAEALSLGDEPPTVDFGYLRPVLKETDYYQRKEVDGREETFSVGMRSLLKDWVVGSNPDSYVYHDPYDETNTNPPAWKPRPQQARPTPQVAQMQPPPLVLTQSQKPPMVIASSNPEQVAGRKTIPPVQTQTQTQTSWTADRQSQNPFGTSQEMMASTQVLPGPYGGRPGVGIKKKAAKKRLGGF